MYEFMMFLNEALCDRLVCGLREEGGYAVPASGRTELGPEKGMWVSQHIVMVN